MERLLLVGSGGFGRVVLEHAFAQYDCAFLDDGDASMVDDVPVIGKTSEMEKSFQNTSIFWLLLGTTSFERDCIEMLQR